ncbi:hypothetical protein POX_b02070 [Penicillium oxalicum]|uniref:hypothetical protein n=1 Tax=Penicillium oxalicum TaxID=69781 RepID=UPI0020B67029|nr:hypothetical protein POX_b02070 [Penicillium oxalicum]KAI2792037.1 hypothetical protein POX_b02070 [Penicillium oxalicum]
MSYYPPGWTYERLLDASGAEIQALPDSQRTALIDGLKETHGEDGFHSILQEMSRRYRARVEATESAEVKQQRRELVAPFYKALAAVYRSPVPEEWGEWGFVVFRTTPYGGTHDLEWNELQKRWNEVFEEQLSSHRGSLDKVDRAIQLLKFQWVEDPALDGVDADQVARLYGDMIASLPQGLATSACLMVTPASLESILNSPLPSSAPRSQRRKIPFAVAVNAQREVSPSVANSAGSVDADVAGADFPGHLNVALETILEEFYPITALQMMDLHSLTALFRTHDDIWCAADHQGVHQNPK